jgi:hypothetical protein
VLSLRLRTLCFPVGAIRIVMVVPVLEPVTAKLMEGGCTWGDATKDLVKNEMRLVGRAALVLVSIV